MNEWLRRLLFLPEQASTIAPDLDGLHFLVIGATLLGASAVAVMTLWFVVRYRAGRGERSKTVDRRRRTRRFEAGLIVGVLALFLFFWVVGFQQYVRMSVPPPDAAEVYVTAKQWMWKFSHPEGHDEVGTLTVPVGRPVRLLLTSRDVIHSFYVPAFRIKQDAVPGRYTSTWFEVTRPGRYDLFCAEYCGLSHSLMRAQVVALAPADYEQWLRGATPAGTESLAERGAHVAATHQCLACHTVDGRRHVAPTWRGLYGTRVVLEGGATVVADEAYVTRSMMRPLDEVVAGYAPVMPAYLGQLTAPDVAALVAYIKSLRDPPDAAVVNAPALWPATSTVPTSSTPAPAASSP